MSIFLALTSPIVALGFLIYSVWSIVKRQSYMAFAKMYLVVALLAGGWALLSISLPNNNLEAGALLPMLSLVAVWFYITPATLLIKLIISLVQSRRA